MIQRGPVWNRTKLTHPKCNYSENTPFLKTTLEDLSNKVGQWLAMYALSAYGSTKHFGKQKVTEFPLGWMPGLEAKQKTGVGLQGGHTEL